MDRYRGIVGAMVTGAVYFAAVAVTLSFARLDDGVAMVWVPGPVLAARLFAMPTRAWPPVLIACAIASELAAGLFGLGWAPGVFISFAAVGEAVAAALLARHALRRHWPQATFELSSEFLLGCVLVIPAASGAIAASAVHALLGQPLAPTFHNWLLGHATGLVAILPFGMALAMRHDRQALWASDHNRTLVSALTVATMVLLTICVFMQSTRLLLVAPLLFALFAAVWAEALAATAMPVVVAMIATPLTIDGFGPFAPGLAMASDRLQFGMFYAGVVAFCSLPVVLEQAQRRQETALWSKSAAHYRAMSQRADDLIDELRHAAMTDPLTGLPNRRAFFDGLREVTGADETACLAMIDIDHFKQVNDQFGHAAGDAVLVQFGRLARGTLRGSDMVARVGGEEFAVILRDAGIEQAIAVCQRLVDRVALAEIATDAGAVRVTISTGIAVIGGDGDAAMAAADRALYQAKRAGRSRLAAA